MSIFPEPLAAKLEEMKDFEDQIRPEARWTPARIENLLERALSAADMPNPWEPAKERNLSTHDNPVRPTWTTEDHEGLKAAFIGIKPGAFTFLADRSHPRTTTSEQLHAWFNSLPNVDDEGEDAPECDLGAGCNCATAPEEDARDAAEDDESPWQMRRTTDPYDKLRLIADTVDGQASYGTELADFKRRLKLILDLP